MLSDMRALFKSYIGLLREEWKNRDKPFNFADDLFTEPVTKSEIAHKLVRSDFDCRHAEYHIGNEWELKNFEDFLNFIKTPIFSLIKNWLGITEGLKVNFDAHATYKRIVGTDFEEECSVRLQTEN